MFRKRRDYARGIQIDMAQTDTVQLCLKTLTLDCGDGEYE